MPPDAAGTAAHGVAADADTPSEAAALVVSIGACRVRRVFSWAKNVLPLLQSRRAAALGAAPAAPPKGLPPLAAWAFAARLTSRVPQTRYVPAGVKW